MFKYTLTLLFLIITCIVLVHPLCLPCQRTYGEKPSRPFQDPVFYQELELRTVYNAHITSPHVGSKWIAGSRATVTWDASDMPQDASNKRGRVVLGYLKNGDEHLDYDHPLADGFDIRQQRVDVNVPMVEPRDDYIIVLFGDSGNRSPKFTISRS